MSGVKHFSLPDLGEGLTEGEIVRWLVAVGEDVALNQPLVEVETAKAMVEIPAKWAGAVAEILVPEGSIVEVGTSIIAIDTGASAVPPPVAPNSLMPSDAALAMVEVAPGEGAVEPGLVGGPVTRGRTVTQAALGSAVTRRARTKVPVPRAGALVQPAERRRSRVLAAPPVRKLAQELGADLSALTGSGPNGTITREDVCAAQGTPADGPAALPAIRPDNDREHRIPVRGVRKLTAENMATSAFTAPHVTEFLTIDMTRAVEVLERLCELPGWQEVRITPLLLVAKACLAAIKRHPLINSTWADSDIVVKDYVNLGIAVATERGLIVPNIKDASELSLRELAGALERLVATARAGKATPADMADGTFTITNVGIFGVDTGTPILPAGEAAILAFGAIRKAPWVHEGNIEVRQVSTLSLSFDHRIIDGELGSRFLREAGTILEDPVRALLAWT